MDIDNAGKCGVTDYALKLASNLRLNGICVELPKIIDLFRYNLLRTPNNILHIQYPCLDSRYSLLPHLFSHFSSNTVITFHETLALHKLRRFSFGLFRMKSAIVTNDYDYNYAKKYITKLVEKIQLAPPFDIKSRILSFPTGPIKLCYFGLLRDGSTVQDLAKFSKLLALRRPDVEFHIVTGKEPSREIREQFMGLNNIKFNQYWHVGTLTEELPELLSTFDMAFLPFPNGADENRSSLLSVIANGVVPIIYSSSRTPGFMNHTCFVSDSPESALNFIPSDRCFLIKQKSLILELAKNYNWDLITQKHIDHYTRLLGYRNA